ncbi:MAG TPA: hypothetical protein VGQ55_10805 [Pyrinomonadaceae bacterium]|nr:hypothetical protein [Pyrinomonadaceae bacterium]
MLYLGLLKRIVPFILTFAAGLFLASFFVTITPSFNSGDGRSWRRNERWSHREEIRQLREENQQLREELDAVKSRMNWSSDVPELLDIPDVPPIPPPMRVRPHSR